MCHESVEYLQNVSIILLVILSLIVLIFWGLMYFNIFSSLTVCIGVGGRVFCFNSLFKIKTFVYYSSF